MKIPFDIKYRPQIESGEYKVETRSGKTARIICWNRVGIQLVVLIGKDEDVLTYNSNGTTGQQMPLPSDLFIITPEEELTEFENALDDIIRSYRCDSEKDDNDFALNYQDWIKKKAAKLLTLARKHLQPQIDAEIAKAYKNADSIVYENGVLYGKAEALRETEQDPESSYAFKRGVEYGKEEALKDLPRWREWGNGAGGNSDGHPIALVSGAGGIRFTSALGTTGEKYIMLDDLEKLPGFKED